jgi:hypothetical protein
MRAYEHVSYPVRSVALGFCLVVGSGLIAGIACTKAQGESLVASVPDAAALGVCIASAALSGESLAQVATTCTSEAVKVGLDLTPLFASQVLASEAVKLEAIRKTPAYLEMARPKIRVVE